MSEKKTTGTFAVPPTLTETIYQYLKQAIADGELKAGQRLQEKDIAEKFHVSVTPVREAFLRLSAEDYLVNTARHEVLVSTHSAAEAMDFYEIIRVLDLYIVKKIILHLKPEDLAELKRMTEELGRDYESKDTQSYMKLNFDIHARIWRFYENKAMNDMLAEILEKLNVFRLHHHCMPYSDRESFRKSYSDHLKLIEYLEARDSKKLKELMLTHWGTELVERPEKAE